MRAPPEYFGINEGAGSVTAHLEVADAFVGACDLDRTFPVRDEGAHPAFGIGGLGGDVESFVG